MRGVMMKIEYDDIYFANSGDKYIHSVESGYWYKINRGETVADFVEEKFVEKVKEIDGMINSYKAL